MKNLINNQPVLSLPFTKGIDSGYAVYKKKLSGHIEQGLDKSTYDSESAILTVLSILLHRYTDQVEFLIGSPKINSNSSTTEEVDKFFLFEMNMTGYEKLTFTELYKKVEKELNNTQQSHSYKTLQAECRKGSPLFQVLYGFTNMTNFSDESSEKVVRQIVNFQEHSGTCLGIYVLRNQSETILHMVYDKSRASQNDVTRMIGHFETLLHCMLNESESLFNRTSLLTEEEHHLLLNQICENSCELPKEGQIHDLFTKQVNLNPEAIAIVVGEKHITYQEVNCKVNQLAYYLQKKGASEGDIIGICLSRSAEIIISQLAVLKIGGAYVPLDPAYPSERLASMMSDSGLKFVLCETTLRQQLHTSDAKIIDLQVEMKNIETESTAELNLVINDNELAYIIYTSGSTGEPKGVMVEHHSIRNLYYAVKEHLCFDKNRSIVALASIAFDIFVIESLIALAYGAKVVIANEIEQHDPMALNELIKNNKIEILPGTPARLQMLLNDNLHTDCLKSLKLICMGGEPFPPRLFEEVRDVTNAKILNIYGPTETTVYATIKELENSNDITIGNQLCNYECYIMDQYMQLQPIGVKGELCIAGAGLARGYHNRDKLNQERFIEHPFKPGKRIYRTGDIALLLANGEIKYIERTDSQVKIRGHRIELGEIEKVLERAPNVRQAVVIDRVNEKGGIFLAAYLIVEKKSSDEKQTAEWREYLKDFLPSYMWPTVFLQMDSLPLTTNGKIDRKKLPNHQMESLNSGNYVAPRSLLEERIKDIWVDVIDNHNIGINDHFLELGGDSLLATLVISRINGEFEVKLTLNEFLSEPTIVEVAAKVSSKTVNQSSVGKKKRNAIMPKSRTLNSKKLTDLSNE
ncbi:non-ribosomal peptide synthetase [Paenibacillus silvae]|nr:non-ribosomal peptide synthetase [Paenibacillus silvae]